MPEIALALQDFAVPQVKQYGTRFANYSLLVSPYQLTGTNGASSVDRFTRIFKTDTKDAHMLKPVLAIAALIAFADQAAAQQTTVTIQGTVNGANGAVGVYGPVAVTLSTVTVTSSTVDKPSAPAGTLRTLTVTATSSSGAALTAPLPTAPGVTFTPVAGQPAGTFKWTFMY